MDTDELIQGHCLSEASLGWNREILFLRNKPRKRSSSHNLVRGFRPMSVIFMLTETITEKNFKNRFLNNQIQQRCQVDRS